MAQTAAAILVLFESAQPIGLRQPASATTFALVAGPLKIYGVSLADSAPGIPSTGYLQ